MGHNTGCWQCGQYVDRPEEICGRCRASARNAQVEKVMKAVRENLPHDRIAEIVKRALNSYADECRR